MKRPRVLIIAEAVTLAHVGRSYSLARMLSQSGSWEVGMATAPTWDRLLGPVDFWHSRIQSISPDTFMERLHLGKSAYTTDELSSYVEEDERVIRDFRPDVIIGEFRLSLAASARRCKVPYAALINAYWSPCAKPKFIVPDIPPARLLGPRLAQLIIPWLVPSFFAVHSLKLNQFKRRLSLPWWQLDLRKVYADADYLLYPDLPGMVPIDSLPAHHRYIGWVPWSPTVPLPDWWNGLPSDRPRVYVSLGSSGPAHLLPQVLNALAPLPITIVASGHLPDHQGWSNVHISQVLPGDAILDKCAVAICNGGSPSVQQALSHGVPVVGIPRNLDQYLNMHYTEMAGAGLMIRSDQLTEDRLLAATRSLLETPTFRERAQAIQGEASRFNGGQALQAFLKDITGR